MADERFADLGDTPEISRHFSPAPPEAWREAVQRLGHPLEHLREWTPDGIGIEPLYTPADAGPSPGFPGCAPFIRGSGPLGTLQGGWTTVPLETGPEPQRVAAHIREAMGLGAGGVWLRGDAPLRIGVEPGDPRAVGGAVDGIVVSTVDDMAVLLGGFDAGPISLRLDGGGGTVPLLALTAAALRARDDGPSWTGALGNDPIGALAENGELPDDLGGALRLLPEVVTWAESAALGIRTVTVSLLPYHLAGAGAANELALALAAAVEYMRWCERGGVAVPTFARHIVFLVPVGRDLFIELAKLRALRRLWSRVLSACGSPEARPAALHAVTSPRSLSPRDPWVNLLRVTEAGFAAVVGGADWVTTLPFDSPLGVPGELGRRLALTTQTILREESHLGRVIDPGGGSWYLESITDQLAHAAWSRFQDIEDSGGIAPAVESGSLRDTLDETRKELRDQVAAGRRRVTGVSSYPVLEEAPVPRPEVDRDGTRRRAAEAVAEHARRHDAGRELGRLERAVLDGRLDGSVIEASIDAAAVGATAGQLSDALRAGRRRVRTVALPKERIGAPFEELRDRADAHHAASGRRPRAHLLAVGPLAEHTVRTETAVHLLASAGIEAVDGEARPTVEAAAEAFTARGARVAVISAGDERAQEVVPALATALKQRGAALVLVAAPPGDHEDAWRAAGVDGFLARRSDLVEELRAVLTAEGVRDA